MVRFIVVLSISLPLVWFLTDLLSIVINNPVLFFLLGYLVAQIVDCKLLPWMGFED